MLSGDKGILLKIENLDVTFEQAHGSAHALRGINLSLSKGEIHSLVGESGSGKTVTSTCLIGLLPCPPGSINSGRIIFEEKDLLSLSEREMRMIRGKKISMVFQEPGKYLNPALRTGEQITEMIILHLGMEKKQAEDKALQILNIVGLKGGRRILRSYPHELSGGMKQRVMIAIAICCNPDLLIADEPTTALDVTLQLQILRLIQRLRNTMNMGVLFISHDLGVVNDISDRISVIYAGKIVESIKKEELADNPLHPYTRLLLLSIPEADKRGTRLRTIPGRVPDAEHTPSGCAFHPRCPLAEEICKDEIPEMIEHTSGHFAACHMIGKKWIDL